jgi:hypothetical protein
MTPKEFAAGLIAHATNYVGLVEIEQNSRWSKPALSAALLKLMKRVPWWAPGAAYCAAFDAAVVIETLAAAGLDATPFLKHWTAHCMTNARKMRELKLLSAAPVKGALWLARHGSTDSGHAGIVTDTSGDSMSTIEGNTSAGKAGSQRNGDGIYARVRNVRSNGNLITQGFVHPGAILKIIRIEESPVVEPAPPEPHPPAAMVPIYGVLCAAGYTDARAVEVIKSKLIPGQQYDEAAQMSVAPGEAVQRYLAAHPS